MLIRDNSFLFFLDSTCYVTRRCDLVLEPEYIFFLFFSLFFLFFKKRIARTIERAREPRVGESRYHVFALSTAERPVCKKRIRFASFRSYSSPATSYILYGYPSSLPLCESRDLLETKGDKSLELLNCKRGDARRATRESLRRLLGIRQPRISLGFSRYYVT